MSSQGRVWLITGLAGVVLLAAIYFPFLRKRVRREARGGQQTEEQARRELIQQASAAAAEPKAKAKLFWAADPDDTSLIPVTVELPLSNDPVLRAKQVLNTLLAGPVDAELRTLPSDAELLAFYLLPDGTAIADFSENLATSTPSGIQSEQLAVDSIVRTLAANVPQVQRVRILIHGQEVETLAGHVDLMEPFVVNTPAVSSTSAPATNGTPEQPGAAAPATPAAQQPQTQAKPSAEPPATPQKP